MRLLFAIQVVIVHVGDHLGLEVPALVEHFPGVPAFFFVSGFLIYASYLNAPGQRYFENRFLRLYPCLVFVTLGGAGVAMAAHGWRDLTENFSTYGLWFIAQITLGQAYNPAHFRDVGVGVINGSLWTLTTEILFYIGVPAIVWLERRFRSTVLVLVTASFAIYVAGPMVWDESVYRDKTLYDFVALTPIAWGWMFGFGMLAVKHFDRLQRSFKYYPLLSIPLVVMIVWGEGNLFHSNGNRLGLVYFACYIGLVLWLAFQLRPVRLTFDLSYGCYVWHMPVINLLLVLALPSVPLALILTASIAALSWFFLEKPALKLKRKSLKPVVDATAGRERFEAA